MASRRRNAIAFPRNYYDLSPPDSNRPMTADEQAREALIAQHQDQVDQRPAAEKAAYFVRALGSIAASSVVIDNNYNSFLSGYIQWLRARVDNRNQAEYNFIQNSLRELEQLAQRDFDSKRDTGAVADLP